MSYLLAKVADGVVEVRLVVVELGLNVFGELELGDAPALGDAGDQLGIVQGAGTALARTGQRDLRAGELEQHPRIIRHSEAEQIGRSPGCKNG